MKHFRTTGEVASPEVLAAIEAVGFQAGRYAPGLGLYLDVRTRLNTLLEIRRGFDKHFGVYHVKSGGRMVGRNGLDDWCFEVRDPAERADRHLYVARFRRLLGELDDQIDRVKIWQSRLDSNSTIDHRPSWSADFRRYQREWTCARLFEHFLYERLPARQDVWSYMIQQGSANARRSEYLSRLDIELAQAVRDGWFVVFDTLTIDPLREDAFFDNPTAFRDHVRRIGRLVNVACGKPARESYDDVFRYFAVPEYGKKTARLHFHCIYFMKRLPHDSTDPNVGRRVRNRREISTLKIWEWGYSAPISARFSGDAFSRAGWLWPVNRAGLPLEAKPPIAIAKYVSKYVTKSFLERTAWQKVNGQERARQFRVRMSRNFGLRLDLSTLSLPVLLEVSCLHYSATRSAKLLRRLALRQMSWKLAGTAIADFLGLIPPQTSLLERLRALTATSPGLRSRSFTDIGIRRLRLQDTSDECRAFLATVPRLSPNSVSLSAK